MYMYCKCPFDIALYIRYPYGAWYAISREKMSGNALKVPRLRMPSLNQSESEFHADDPAYARIGLP